MIRHFSPSDRRTSGTPWALFVVLALMTCLLGGCAGSGSAYHATAYEPAVASAVRVKVSLNQQMIYVLEGNRCLMATPTCVGRAGDATPTGNFRVILKNPTKRSETYGYWVNGDQILPGTSSQSPSGDGWHYVGYPMAYWVEFAPGYGFHEGPIWPYPRSHGCLHVHEAASAKLFELVRVGTPVEIASSLPEDALYGRNVARPTDYADPDPPPQLMISSEFFQKPRDTRLLKAPPANG
jgi:hypothetical protein